MTDDERQKLMDFIVSEQAAITTKLADVGVKLDRLGNGTDHLAHRMERDERILTLMLRAGRRARSDLRDTQRIVKQNSVDIKALIDSQLRSYQETRELRQSVERLHETVERNSEEIRRNSEDIRRNSEDIRLLASRGNGNRNS